MIMAAAGVAAQGQLLSLVPTRPSTAPDYLCTWNLQGYVISYDPPSNMRSAMVEANIFGQGPYQNWISFYPQIRRDLYFVMDDSWDVPLENNNAYMGSAEVNEERFPSLKGTPTKRLKQLTERIKSAGWKGAGGWICAQKPESAKDIPEEEYWTSRLKDAHLAGFSYWKVDYGRNERNTEWRRMLTRLGRQFAPHLEMEHAMNPECVEFSDVFRTYDVENIIAQSTTIQRVANLLPLRATGGAKGIINCEDEPYIAVGLGCAIGIMRHPFVGNLPNGRQDDVFPPVGHNYKRCLDEVVRAVRWHRLALPFGVNDDAQIDNVNLNDYWEIHENETWNHAHSPGTVLRESAPARIARNMPLPEVMDTTFDRPFILASTYPNNAIAVAAIGRALGRDYVEKAVAVTVVGRDQGAPIGLFGYFKEVTIVYPSKIKSVKRVLAQDLAGDTPVDITKDVQIHRNSLVIPGRVIHKVGLMCSSEGDLSGPGMVVKLQ